MKRLCETSANKVGADYEHYNPVERVEMKILLKIFNDAFDKMSAAEKNGIIKAFEQAGVENLNLRAGFPAAAILAQLAVKSSGFLAYQIAVIVANNVAKAVLGHGLKLATNAALTSAIGIFAGPIGWVITGLWTAISVSGPDLPRDKTLVYATWPISVRRYSHARILKVANEQHP